MRTKFNGIITLLLVLFVQISFAQEKTVSGTVSDTSGTLPGVSVIIKGTTTGTETDFDGKYSIKVKIGDILSFSYLGYVKVEKNVGNASTINVTLKEDANVLDEVVVIGYGTTTKQAFTGSAKVVKAEDLERKSVSNISQALAGEIAGVNVITTSGQPGTSAVIRIRGFGSVNGNRSPLYVVDGVPFSGALNSINPSDIESTTVLKDATATAIYGARGANGVILITTKTGKNGVTTMEVDVKTGVNFSSIPRYDIITSPEEYIEVAWASMGGRGENFGNDAATYANDNLFGNRGINPKYNLWNTTSVSDLIDPTTGKVRSNVTRKYSPENWQDYGFQTSIRTEANLKMSGGNDKTKYFSSFGYLDDIGYIINSKYKRVTTRLNITHKPKEWLTASTSIGYSVGETTNNGQTNDSGSIFWFVDNIPSIYPLFERDVNGALIPDIVYGGNVFDYGVGRGFGALTNAIGDATNNFRGNKRHSLNGNFSFNVKFSDNLSFETKYGLQYYNQISNTYNNPFYGSGAPADVAGSLSKGFNTAVTQNFLNMFRYNNTFGDHSI
ncbi:MAG: SusC/RagA family TonB-linked outer membrane protein, partial [Flavobacteriaceae bacterium]|nr:SusC/RagA family TonB-linked outer membrane protein [Flavobacteriaceae bacterium]